MNEFVVRDSVTNVAQDSSALVVGEYAGMIINAFHCEQLSQALSRLPDLLQAQDAELIAGGRNQNVRLMLPFQGGRLAVLVKSFGKQKRWKDHVDIRYRKTKAQRSFEAALHLRTNKVGTPAPVAFLERRCGNRLEESYFISLFEEQVTSFHDQIISILNGEPTCGELAPMLARVAELCRAMHDAGYIFTGARLRQNYYAPGIDAMSAYFGYGPTLGGFGTPFGKRDSLGNRNYIRR